MVRKVEAGNIPFKEARVGVFVGFDPCQNFHYGLFIYSVIVAVQFPL